MHLARALRRRSVPHMIMLSALGCAEPVAPTARPVAGCYRLEITPLSGASLPVAPLPDSVRLFDDRGIGTLEDGRALLRAWPDSLRTAYRWSWWEIAKPDTLKLVFTTGFDGARMALRPTSHGFGGLVYAFSDVEPAPPSGAIARLRPIACANADPV